MHRFTRLSRRVTDFTGSLYGSAVLGVLLVGWLIWGAVSGWGRPWELTVSLGVPLLTLGMVSLLQHAQNRQARALQVKLNELLLALEQPDARVADAERRPDEELHRLDEEYRRRARQAAG